MVADIGTKALAANRLEDLKKRMNVKSMEETKGKEEKVEAETGKESQEKEEMIQKIQKSSDGFEAANDCGDNHRCERPRTGSQ